jgi:hypothetical protein
MSSKQSEATKAAREAKANYERRERIGAAWYQYEHAVQGLVPGKPYNLRDDAEREAYRVRGESAARTLGLTP